MSILKQIISKYTINSEYDYFNAIREVLQEIALAGLYRGSFYSKAAFYGGTALRIFYGLDRFSEDMDFSLLEPNKDFTFEDYFPYVKAEFVSLGIEVELKIKEKQQFSGIESAFLKADTTSSQLNFNFFDKEFSDAGRHLKIKIEVDKTPPLKFKTEEKLLLEPFSFYTKCFELSSLFAGKMHALLFRNWKNRVKGRDWYDFVWYVKNRTILDLNHFKERAFQSGHLKTIDSFSANDLLVMLHTKIDALNLDYAKDDIIRFIDDDQKISVWSKDYFHQVADKVIIQ